MKWVLYLFPDSSPQGRLLGGGIWAFGGRIALTVTGLCVNILLARLLPIEQMGSYFLISSFVSFATTVAQLGLGQTSVRLIAESMGIGKPGRARSMIHFVMFYGMIGALLTAAVSALVIQQWLPKHISSHVSTIGIAWLVAAWIVVLSLQLLVAEIFRGFHGIRESFLFGGLTANALAIVLLIALWIAKRNTDLSQVLMFLMLTGAISVCFSLERLWRKTKAIQNREPIEQKRVFEMAGPVFITNIILFVITQADIWIVGMFRSASEVAIYGAALRLVSIVSMPLLIVNAVVPPLIAEMYVQGKKEDLQGLLRSGAALAGIPSLLLSLALIIWGAQLLAVIYGDYYRNGAIVLTILSVGQLANVLTGSCGLTLMMTNNQSALLRITIFSGIAITVMAIVAVNYFGLVGVATSISVGLVVQNTAMWLETKRKTNIWTHFGILDLANLVKNRKVSPDVSHSHLQ